MTAEAPAGDIYIRCRACGFTSPPSSMSYVRSADGTGIDWSQRVEATCMICHAAGSPVPADAMALDDAMTCPRCQAAAPCPAGAARVRCPGCGLFLVGHRLTGRQQEELRATETSAAAALRTRWLLATQSGGGRTRLGRHRGQE
jgi:DNA-directed RNA polymerase subunit RPC12/RpoP